MAERRPAGMSHERWVDRQIRESMARGEFDGLRASGKPIEGLEQPLHEDWWIREKLKRENVTTLPPALQIRRDADTARERIAAATDEGAVRDILADLNARIRYVNSHTVVGPPPSMMPLDVEEEVARWRAARAVADDGHGEA